MTVGASSSCSLSPVEDLFFRIADDVNGDGTCHVSVRLAASLEPEPLRRALAALQQRHPKLRARVGEATGGLSVYEACTPVPPIPLEIRDGEEDLPLLIEDPAHWSNGIIGSRDQPLIRVRVLRAPHQPASILTLTVSHAFGGGASQTLLVSDLLAYYAQAREQEEDLHVESLPMVSVTGCKRSGSCWSRWGIGWNRFRYVRACRRGFVALPRAESGTAGPRCNRWTFDAKASMAMVRRCKKEDTSIFGALLAASLLGVRQVLGEESIRVTWRCPIECPDELEGSHGPLTPSGLGVYGIVYGQLYVVDRQASFWSLAREARKDVRTFAEAGGAPLMYRLVNRLLRRRFRSGRRKPGTVQKRPTLQVSYAGFFDAGPEDEDLAIQDWSLAVTSTQTGPSIMVGAYMLKNCLHFLAFGFDLDRDFWDRYYAAMRKELRQALDPAKEDA